MQLNTKYELLAELVCELTRNCSVKEEQFAASFNLSPSEVRFLKLFAFNDEYSIKEIRDAMGLTSGRITHVLGSLEEKKLLLRHHDEKDKRNIIVKLLPKAKPLIRNLKDKYSNLHKNMLESLSDEDMEKIYYSMKVLVEKFKNWVNQ